MRLWLVWIISHHYHPFTLQGARGCCWLMPLHGATGSGTYLEGEEGGDSSCVVVVRARCRLSNVILVSP